MQKFNMIKAHLADNTGDENIAKMVWVVIVFVVGAAILAIFSGIFKDEVVGTWIKGNLDKLMESGNFEGSKLGE